MNRRQLRHTDPGTLLGVWAHPDDEAYLSAGLMATARRHGHRVVVATATRGEHGTDEPESWPPHRLAAVRERELMASLAAVGVHEHRWLGYYEDGTLSALTGTRRAAAVDAVARLIEEIHPDTVVTFGPDGMTGHPDHRTVSSWVGEAWLRTGSTGRLWHATLAPSFHRRWGRLNDRVGLWLEGATPPATPRQRLAAEVRCRSRLLRVKHAALLAHASQTRGLAGLVGERRYRRWWSTEWFVTAPAATAPRAAVLHDPNELAGMVPAEHKEES